MTNLQKYENMLSVFKAAKQDKMPKSLQMQLLGHVFALGPKASIYDAELFSELVACRELLLEA